ncbi:MAG: AAA family ATPase [Hungatella sp.]|jgi:DNA transposition AAA+ family ATPase|nr:AAA family ATPase [Hungatella sp.]
MEVSAAVNALTYIETKGIAGRVNAYITKTGTSIAALAKAVNYSRPTLSRYLSGKYDSDATELESRLAEYLQENTGEMINFPSLQEKTVAQRPKFFESRDAKAILGVCQSCQDYIGLGIVVGRSGYGKTYTLKQYAKLPRVAYIECDDTMSLRDLVEAIEKALGLPSGYGTIWKRVNNIRDYCNTNKGYLIIIDEADKLVSKYTQKKMEILRAIYDQADVGIVIAGEPKLEAQIKSYLVRMANRVDFYVSLKGLSGTEVEAFLSEFDIEEKALSELKARACNLQTGCFRLLDRTLNNVSRIVSGSGETITLKTIEQASGMMML